MATEKKAGRKKGSVVPENETKAQRFVRIARKRVPRATKAINSIAALSGAGYEYTDEQRDKIVGVLEAAVANTVGSLKRERKAAVEFDL